VVNFSSIPVITHIDRFSPIRVLVTVRGYQVIEQKSDRPESSMLAGFMPDSADGAASPPPSPLSKKPEAKTVS
jgi:hypothetical protein